MGETDTALPEGISVGHFTDEVGRTGCTVILAPGGAVAGVDVRGAAPGTLGTDAIRPGTIIERGHGLLLTGGSLFGLAAAHGVLRYLEERGVGAEFGSISIPGVSGAVIFDLLIGDPRARPGPDAGYAACEAATRAPAIGASAPGPAPPLRRPATRARRARVGWGSRACEQVMRPSPQSSWRTPPAASGTTSAGSGLRRSRTGTARRASSRA